MTQQTVFVVDDEPVVREMLKAMLEAGGHSVECHESAESLLTSWSEGRHGCLVLDMVLPGMSGAALQEELARRGINLPIVFLSGHGDIPTTVKAIRGGALDFLTKPVSRPVLLKAVEAALELDRQSLQAESARSHFQARLDKLSQRERQVLDLAISGMQNKEIARELGLSHRTVEVHRSRLFLKLGVISVVDAMRHITELGKPLGVVPGQSPGENHTRDADES